MRLSESAGYGPEGRPRVIVLTFDNLGEASALERGRWAPETPLGHDPSVTQVLPRLLDGLEEHGLAATFFIEAINCELNPKAVREIAARGHELGVHGWSHEHWASLPIRRERSLLERCGQAFDRLGLDHPAFRPPGGELTENTEALLRRLGYSWCSPAAGPARVRDGLATVPFTWEMVDAYHLMDRFAERRAGRGAGAATVAPAELADRYAAALSDGERVQTVILHPFLMLDEEWFAGVRRLLVLMAELSREGQAWVVPGGRFADWLRGGMRE